MWLFLSFAGHPEVSIPLVEAVVPGLPLEVQEEAPLEVLARGLPEGNLYRQVVNLEEKSRNRRIKDKTVLKTG